MRFRIYIFLFLVGFIISGLAVEKSGNAQVQSQKPVQAETRAPSLQAQADQDLRSKQWSLMFYVGAAATQQLGTLIRGKFNSAGETIYTAEVAYTLDINNWLRKFLSPVVDTVQLAGNITKRDARKDPDPVYEYDGYIILRWTKFPWRKYLRTSLAAGEGVSYASHVPYVEQCVNSTNSRRLLNYLMFEVTFALPKYPDVELVGRIHHRSKAYGVFGNGNAGSNDVGVGVRYYF